MAGQIWATGSLGGLFYSLELSDELRQGNTAMVKFRQFCDVRNAAGKNRGETFTWDTVNNITRANRALTETNTVPQGNATIVQGTLTISERGFAVPYTGKLEAMSKFNVRNTVMKALKRDAAQDLDALAHAQFNATPLRVVPVAGTSTSSLNLTTNGTATVTNTVALRSSHVKLVSDLMKERNIPQYVADDYVAIAWPSTYRALKNDIEAVHLYTESGMQMIFNGEIGRYESIRFIEQTNVPKGGAADSSTWNAYTQTADAWDTALSDWCFFFGEDTVAEGISIPEEVRAQVFPDFDRSKAIAWYALLGYGLVHTTALNARIVKWDSAS